MSQPVMVQFPEGRIKEKRSFLTDDKKTMYCVTVEFFGGSQSFYSMKSDFYEASPDEGQPSLPVICEAVAQGKLLKPIAPQYAAAKSRRAAA